MFSKRYLVVVAMLMALAAMTLHSCKKEKHYHDYFDKSQLEVIAKLGNKPKLDDKHLEGDTTWVDKDGMHHITTNPLPGAFDDLFMDYNDVQIPHARKNGFEPIDNYHDAYHLRQPLVKIESCEAYRLDTLTHSMPYLVPKAALLLEEIGCAFADSVKAHGGSAYQIVVTSCTRSQFTVNKLMKVNRNASSRSCHMFGTTFDLSWVHFEPYENNYIINTEDLKNILGHVLLDFKEKKRCTVLYEKGQCCFHLTVI
jgi:hypothetical protein